MVVGCLLLCPSIVHSRRVDSARSHERIGSVGSKASMALQSGQSSWIEDVQSNSAPGELAYLQWAVTSISDSREKVVECSGAPPFGSCPYTQKRNLIPIFVVGGQCPGSNCKEKQAMLYAIPEDTQDISEVQTIWTWDTIGGEGPPCAEDAAFPTHNLNTCGDSKNAPTDTIIVSVKNEYLKLLRYFTISLVNGVPRFVFTVDGRQLFMVAMIIEEITWGGISADKFKGLMQYQDPNADMQMMYQEVEIDASVGSVEFMGDVREGDHSAFQQ